jgi:putative phosphoribosyl transferase
MGRVKCDATNEIRHRGIMILAGKVELEGILTIPERAEGIVIFANESGGGRFDPPNRYVASRQSSQ